MKPLNAEHEYKEGYLLDTVVCPKGEFLFGDEKIPTKVDAFEMGKYPVTQQQYEDIMDENPSNHKDPNAPVTNVNWHQAVEFCEKLAKLTGLPFRLPTEEEWEYACRAGSTTQYYWGDDFNPEYAWYAGNAEHVMPVGRKKPNNWGLYDMLGNVWEWTTTQSGSFRVLRGGSWDYFATFLQVGYRSYYFPYYEYGGVGFRVSLPFSNSSKEENMKDEKITEQMILPTSWREVLDIQKILLAGTDITSAVQHCQKTQYMYFAFNGDIYTRDGHLVMLNRPMLIEDLK